MKAGNYRTPVKILRKVSIETEYRTKEEWQYICSTKCFFEFLGGNREAQNTEIFFSSSARITLRSYIDIQDEDHVVIDEVEYRVMSIDKQPETEKNCIYVTIEKVNK